MNSNNFTPANNIEKMLFVMPKNCKCPICEASKAKAEKELGSRKFKKLAKKLGFAS